MPIPTRPVTAAAVAAEWGQQIHDYTFAPAGCIAEGNPVTMLTGNAYRDLPLDITVEDPGGYHDAGAHKIEVPADGAGLYHIILWASTVDGSAADETGIVVRLNGSEIARTQAGQEGATAVTLGVSLVEPLTVGDEITLRVRQIGAGARADVHVRSLTVVRIGAELGAPS